MKGNILNIVNIVVRNKMKNILELTPEKKIITSGHTLSFVYHNVPQNVDQFARGFEVLLIQR